MTWRARVTHLSQRPWAPRMGTALRIISEVASDGGRGRELGDEAGRVENSQPFPNSDQSRSEGKSLGMNT